MTKRIQTNDLDPTEVGKRIRALRIAHGIGGQRELAELLGVHLLTVSRWETGKKLPDSDSLDRLCNALGVSQEHLLRGVEQTPGVTNAQIKAFLLSEHTKRLTPKQKAALAVLLEDVDQRDEYKLRAALDLLIPEKR